MEREREDVNTEKSARAWPSELAHFSAAFPLAPLGAAWTPPRALAAHPGPLSKQKHGQLLQKGPAHTRQGHLCPNGIAPFAPWVSTTPSTLCSPAGEGGELGPGALWTRLLRRAPPTPTPK